MIQGGGHEMDEGQCMAVDGTRLNLCRTTSLEHITTLMRWISSITPNVDGLARTMVMRLVNETTQPDVIRRKSVMFKSDLLPLSFDVLPIFPQSFLTSTSLFLSSLRRITYACSITCPSGKRIAMF